MDILIYKNRKNLKKIKILFDKNSELGYYIIKIKEIRRFKKWQESTQENRQEKN